MTAVLTALLFGGSRDSWLSFALGAGAGLALLISKRLRRKEDR